MDFDAWMLKRAKEKPNNPLYAHLQARAALSGGDGVESPKEADSVRLAVGPEARGKLKDALDMEQPDFKLKAAGEEPEEVWDGSEPED